jgi:hypothetical protein
MNTCLEGGFEYLVEVVKDGRVVDSERVCNLMPSEGITYMLNTTFKGGAQVTGWYVGLYEGNYTPSSSDTAAALPALATECTAYAETARVQWVSGAVSSGTLDNVSSRAEFTFNATKTVYGGFITSSATKGSTSGVLSSVVRFASPKSLDSGSVLRVTAGFTLASA